MSEAVGEVQGPDHGNILVGRFFGGKRRGVMYQLTEAGRYAGVRGDYVQVSVEQLEEILRTVRRAEANRREKWPREA